MAVKGDPKVIEYLNEALKNELTAINQYFLHYRLLDHWGVYKLAEFERHMGDAHFCWIGGTGEDSPFYYRIQSPVTFIEFDHHAGVFLTNPEPAKFHVHTIVRTPNGNDYGFDLLRQHYKTAPHHQQSQQQQARHHGHHHQHGHHHHRHGDHAHDHHHGDGHHHHDHDHSHDHGHHHHHHD